MSPTPRLEQVRKLVRFLGAIGAKGAPNYVLFLPVYLACAAMPKKADTLWDTLRRTPPARTVRHAAALLARECAARYSVRELRTAAGVLAGCVGFARLTKDARTAKRLDVILVALCVVLTAA